jgi:hypothetical protein
MNQTSPATEEKPSSIAHKTHPEREELRLIDPVLLRFIADVEGRDFRTEHDTGANFNALYIWNHVRRLAGLEPLKKTDLPAFCVTCEKYHHKPHQRKEQP